MPPVNDDFANAIVITGDQGEVLGTTVGATWQTGEPGSNRATIWYQWTPATSGDVRVRVRGLKGFGSGGTLRAQVKLFTGTVVTALTEVTDGLGSPVAVGDYSWPVTGGVTYHLQVQFPVSLSQTGTIDMTWRMSTPAVMTFRGAASVQTTSTSIPVPTPSGVELGDVMVVFVAWDGVTTTMTPPANVGPDPLTEWRGLAAQTSFGGAATMRIRAWAKVVDTNDLTGPTHTWSGGGTSTKSVGIVAYSSTWVFDTGEDFDGVLAALAPGSGASTDYKTSFAVGSGSGGGEGTITPNVPNTVELNANATAGGSGGALTITNGAIERAREDGPIPLIVTEGASTFTYPSATERYTFRLLLAPDEVFGEFAALGGWGVGQIRMSA